MYTNFLGLTLVSQCLEVLRANTASLINFGLEKVRQDSVCPLSPTLDSWRTGWFLRH